MIEDALTENPPISEFMNREVLSGTAQTSIQEVSQKLWIPASAGMTFKKAEHSW